MSVETPFGSWTPTTCHPSSCIGPLPKTPTDTVYADNNIDGDDGNDVVVGSFGEDNLNGGDGADKVIEGPWKDRSFDNLDGNAGDDFLNSATEPAAADDVDCGPGIDTVQADTADDVNADCEKVEILQDVKKEFQARRTSAQGDFTTQAATPAFGFQCTVPGYFRGLYTTALCATSYDVEVYEYIDVAAQVTQDDRSVGFSGQVETDTFVGSVTVSPISGPGTLWTNTGSQYHSGNSVR